MWTDMLQILMLRFTLKVDANICTNVQPTLRGGGTWSTAKPGTDNCLIGTLLKLKDAAFSSKRLPVSLGCLFI